MVNRPPSDQTDFPSPAFSMNGFRLGHLFQVRPVQLPGGGERHVVEDDYFLGRFVADPCARELDQFLAGGALGSLGEGDVGADVLTVDKVMDPDHPGARDAGVLKQGALDLLGADVGAVVDDDLLFAPAEEEVALLIGSHHIAGVEPPVAEGPLGRAWVVPVADGGRGSVDPQAAFAAHRQLLAVIVSDGQPDGRNDLPDRTNLDPA